MYPMPRKFFGRWILAATFITFGLSVGIPYYNIGFFYDYFQREFHWSRADITLGFPLAAALTIWFGPIVIHRFSPRKLILVGTVLTILALTGLSSTQALSEDFPHVLTFGAEPPLSFEVDGQLKPVVQLKFPLQFTHVDRRIFVDADASRHIRRLDIFQFERVKPGANFRFVYPPRPPQAFGAHTYRFGAYIYNDAHEAASQPTMESARTRIELERLHYHVPTLLQTARLARVTDLKGQSEVIIFYCENADTRFPSGRLPNADADGDLVLNTSQAQALFKRLSAVVRQLSG